MDKLVQAINTAAVDSCHTTKMSRQQEVGKKPIALKEAHQAIFSAQPGDARKEARKIFLREKMH